MRELCINVHNILRNCKCYLLYSNSNHCKNYFSLKYNNCVKNNCAFQKIICAKVGKCEQKIKHIYFIYYKYRIFFILYIYTHTPIWGKGDEIREYTHTPTPKLHATVSVAEQGG